MRIDLKKNIKYLDMIRDHVDKVLIGTCNSQSVKKVVEMNLYKLCDGKTNFIVNIVKADPKQKPFIMSVGPDPEELQKRALPLVERINETDLTGFTDIWNDIPQWYIEIDSRTLQKGNQICFDNGSQFVAVLCHELGHIQSTHPARLVFAYKQNLAKFSLYQKMFLKEGKSIAKLFIPFFLCAEGLRIIVNKPITDANEIVADYMVPDKYKYYLIQYTNNHIIPYGVGSDIIQTDEENMTEYDKGVEFTKETIYLMKKRRAALTMYLNNQYLLTPSNYYKMAYAIVSKAVSGTNIETGKTNTDKEKYISECFNRDDAMVNRKLKFVVETTRISERDIMVLSIRADDIQTPEDKVYIINTIYDYIEILEKQRDKDISKCKDASKLPKDVIYEPKLKMLYDIKNKVMDKKVYTNGDKYGLYIKYPEGYEG